MEKLYMFDVDQDLFEIVKAENLEGALQKLGESYSTFDSLVFLDVKEPEDIIE